MKPSTVITATREYRVKIRYNFIAFSLFLHLWTFGYTATLILIGAATVVPQLTFFQTLYLIGIALNYQIFAYVLNDVIDIPVDSTAPLRVDFPLVRGQIRPWAGLAIALFQIPLAFTLTARQTENGWTFALLGASFLLMAVYNLWGKHCLLPPLTDLAQGLAWGTLVLFGATIVAIHISRLTFMIFVFEILLTLLLNGIHSSLRDLANDLDHGVRSTAIMLGARLQGSNKLIIPDRLMFYSTVIYLALISWIGVLLAQNDFGYKTLEWSLTLIVILVTIVLSLVLYWFSLQLVRSSRATHRLKEPFHSGVWFAVLMTSLPIVLLFFHMDHWLRVATLTVYIVPLFAPYRYNKQV